MKQNDLFATDFVVPFTRPFSKEARDWVRQYCGDQINVTKYRAIRNQIFEFLDISDYDDIQLLIKDTKLRAIRHDRAVTLLANMFGIDGNSREIQKRLHEYAHTANDVISYLSSKIMAPYSSHIETTNEIEVTSDPVDLLLIVFDDRYHKKARFEAKRKLTLMNLAGSIDQRERETDIENKFNGFLHFLNEYVWSPSMKIGELEIVYLISQHDAESFACTHVKVMDEKARQALPAKPGQKITLIKRRRFSKGKREIPIYVTIRKKPPAAKVLKLLRKNQKNPAVAVDDELGLMAVLNTISDVQHFQQHLTQSALKIDSFMTLEDISDTLTGKSYRSHNTGSSEKTQMLKFFARLGGMRVEFILHTNQSYLNYIYQRDVAHDEYEVKSIFDSGVAELLFPPDIYKLNLNDIKAQQLNRFRRQIEEL